ncbi:MAG TPA: alpha/beta hydrolase fold domain-containing protein, partial [Acidothermaceae bacterium]|nr:alpha/beta hydrolase fold domain-containing protein [Acidothermaceae bacterium]
VDYRLAPEHPYPAAVHDAAAAVSWLEVHVADVAGAAVPLVLLGDSAGGNLATGAALGNPRAAQALVLAYPVTDCDFETASYVDPENQLLMGVETMRWFFRHYAPDPDSWTRPDISVLRARDVSQLPPTLILLAEHDPLRDEGQAFADRMAAVGVPVDTRLFAGQMHGFLGLINLLPGAEAAVDAIVDHLQPVLAARPLSEAKADV